MMHQLHSLLAFAALPALVVAIAPARVWAQTDTPSQDVPATGVSEAKFQELLQRFEKLEQANQDLQAQNKALTTQYQELTKLLVLERPGGAPPGGVLDRVEGGGTGPAPAPTETIHAQLITTLPVEPTGGGNPPPTYLTTGPTGDVPQRGPWFNGPGPGPGQSWLPATTGPRWPGDAWTRPAMAWTMPGTCWPAVPWAVGACVPTRAPAPQMPYKVAAGTGPIRINYRMDYNNGRINVEHGTLAEARSVTIDLNGLAAGPAAIKVEFFANVPGVPTPLSIGTFYSVPGSGGHYVLNQAALAIMARNFVWLMNDLDTTYSSRHLIPSMRASLRISGDDPHTNAGTFFLRDVLTLAPTLSN